MTVDTAAASSQIGVGDPTKDLNGGAPESQPTGPDGMNDTSSLDVYYAKQAAEQQAAANAALVPVPHTNTGAGTQDAADIPIPHGVSEMGSRILDAAEKYLNVPYRWGQESPTGVDCSGLVQAVYRAVGINLPRISFQQANSGTRVPINRLRVGDLVAWDNSTRNPGADHIAIYAGNGKVIEAAAPGTNVRYSSIYDIGQAWGVRMGWSG